MKVFLGIAALFPITVFAQSVNQTYLAGLAKALNDSGLTQLATVAAGITNTTVGVGLLSTLPTQNFTVFAPDDNAFDEVPDSVTSNTTLLAEILSYHIVVGNFTDVNATYPNVTVGRTLLNDSEFVSLEGNKRQVVVWTNENGSTILLNQATNVTVSDSASYENLDLYIIDGVLQPPSSLSTVLTTQNLTILKTILSSINIQLTSNTTSTTLLSSLDKARGFTLFAPSDSALALAASTISSLNKTVQGTVLGNHFVNGSTVYSTSISSSTNLTSSNGEKLSFMTNTTGVYVVSGNSTAKIVKTDVLTKNGVVHIIDGVLVNTEVNAAVASSAFASATSVAAASVTETGPVGATTTTSSTSSSGNAISLTFSNNGGMMGGLIAIGAFLAGGLLVA